MHFHEKNRALNNEEYQDRRIVLSSLPPTLFIQMDAPCNHDCLFCSRPSNYSYFKLDDFRGRFENILEPVFRASSQINLTGSGELLSLPQAKRNLDYFNKYFHAEKMFATNGTFLTKKMIDHIAESGNRYLLHISLHASNESLHTRITGKETFSAILSNLTYLKKVKEGNSGDNLKYNFIFVATQKNISNLKDFIHFAAEYKADSVIVYYNYVYRLDQKYLSCYFSPEKTNKAIKEAENLKDEYEGSLRLILPPLFKRKYSRLKEPCTEAWSQTMINMRGDVISCDVGGDSFENLAGKSDFMEIWNGDYYQNLRKKLISQEFDCASFCWRANKNTVNDFKSHIITRGKSDEEMKELLKGAEG